MPELPEVETVVKSLQPLVSQKICKVAVGQYQLRIGSKIPKDFIKRTIGATVTNIKRVAKYILIRLDNNETIVGHLGMSGNLLLKPKKYIIEKHNHVVMVMSKNTLVYNDPRRFGLIDLIATKDEENYFASKKMGPDALSNEFNSHYLKKQFEKRKTPIKIALLNQEIVAGLGNIYVCEALFMAKINPCKKSCDLSERELIKLVPIIKKVLNKAIDAGGTTLKDHKSADGSPGYFSQELLVYGRENQECTECQNNIKRCIIGGRSTFFCPNCQK